MNLSAPEILQRPAPQQGTPLFGAPRPERPTRPCQPCRREHYADDGPDGTGQQLYARLATALRSPSYRPAALRLRPPNYRQELLLAAPGVPYTQRGRGAAPSGASLRAGTVQRGPGGPDDPGPGLSFTMQNCRRFTTVKRKLKRMADSHRIKTAVSGKGINLSGPASLSRDPSCCAAIMSQGMRASQAQSVSRIIRAVSGLVSTGCGRETRAMIQPRIPSRSRREESALRRSLCHGIHCLTPPRESSSRRPAPARLGSLARVCEFSPRLAHRLSGGSAHHYRADAT